MQLRPGPCCSDSGLSRILNLIAHEAIKYEFHSFASCESDREDYIKSMRGVHGNISLVNVALDDIAKSIIDLV